MKRDFGLKNLRNVLISLITNMLKEKRIKELESKVHKLIEVHKDIAIKLNKLIGVFNFA